MSTTTAPVLTLLVGASAEVLDKTAQETLAMLAEQRRRQDQAAARELVAVTHWADLHRVDDSADPVLTDPVEAQRSRECGQPVLGREGQLWLAGEGVFAVEEFAVSQVATVLGVPETAARSYLGQSLELRERLPRCWAKVMVGELPAWKGRQIAAETIALNPAAAAYVDAHLAPFVAKMSLSRILRCVHAAIIRHDRPLAAERAKTAGETRGVWVDDDIDGTSRITAVTNTPDAVAFDAAVHQVATDLHTLGSTAPEQVRRATAVGILADPQHALDLHTIALAPDSTDTTDTPDSSGTGEADAVVSRRSLRSLLNHQGPTFHIHLHTDATEGLSPVARVQGYGPQSLETIERWLADLGAAATVKLTPVVDLTEHISVDAYENPRLRAQVEHRDHGCRFPWCGRQGRFDADHIDPYVPPDDGGPPDQTNTANLARLCRFHHRVKTHGGWHYRRQPDDTLLWTSPQGRTYTVDQHGTVAHG